MTLRPFRDDDLPVMEEAIADPEVVWFTTGASSASPELTHDFLRRWYGSRNQQVNRLDLAIVDNNTGRGCVGEVVLNEWDQNDNGCNYRVLIGPRGRGRGLGTEATQLVLGYAFTTLGLHRVSLEVFAFNARALRVYQKAGFRLHGERRADIVSMTILAGEWTIPPVATLRPPKPALQYGT